jgi:hypothetical protein
LVFDAHVDVHALPRGAVDELGAHVATAAANAIGHVEEAALAVLYHFVVAQPVAPPVLIAACGIIEVLNRRPGFVDDIDPIVAVLCDRGARECHNGEPQCDNNWLNIHSCCPSCCIEKSMPNRTHARLPLRRKKQT